MFSIILINFSITYTGILSPGQASIIVVYENMIPSSVKYKTGKNGLTEGSKFCEKSLNDVNVSPSFRSGCLQLSRTLRIA